ncbi:MAG TPA: beta-propeller fold lactonase family protein [Acidobacteriaceae bacterium]|nr:beta-propeller fold lactonase family protein [Acidobacteriaceae bacterium]
MKFSNLGRKAAALVSTLALGACLSSCGSGTIGYLYVLGQLTSSGSFGQINGFKIDDRTGNLTNMVNSPYSSGGSNPGNAVVFPGGQYLFVLNKGIATTAPSGQCPANTGGGVVSEFLIGGDGVLTFLQNWVSSGINPVWISADPTGSYLYVLDQAASTPGPLGNTCNLDTTSANSNVKNKVPDGDITVFALNSTTGRLTLVQNQQANDGFGHPLTFFPVGPHPTMLHTAGGYVYTMNTADQSVFVDSTISAGQLTATQTLTQPTGGINITSIGTSSNGNYIYITDEGLGGSNPSYIRIFTIGSNGALSTLVTGAQTNLPLTSNPVWTLASANGKYLYVVNQGNNANPNTITSNISAFTVESTGQLQQVVDPSNPYPAGSGPVCMVEDPTNQYVYVSNYTDSTVTGYILDANTGQLSPLSRTTVFPISGQASCLTVSGFTS